MVRTTPLTAYQKHVKKFAETYTGKNLMKAASKTWSKTAGAPKKKPRTSSPSKKGGKKQVTKKKSGAKKGGFKLPGGLSPKGIIMGALAMTFIPRVLPIPPQASKLGAGLVLRALNIGGGGALSAVGLMELVAAYASPLLGGVVPGLGGNGAQVRSYDY